MSRRKRGLIRLAGSAQRRPVRSVAAWLGMLGLLLQLCLPLVHHPTDAAPTGLSWLGGAICIGAGHPAPDGGSVPAPGKPTLCPICLALALGGVFLLPTLAALVLALALFLVVRVLPAPPSGTLWLGLAALPRAPPVTV